MGTMVARGDPVAPAASAGRRTYLDWLRGVAVLVMIEAHTFDAWTLPSERLRPPYGWAVMLGGMGAPLFLFLAGVSVAFAAAARARKLGSDATAAASVRRRGWQIYVYAFLFRLQSLVLNPGSDPSALLKVDILNIMGPSIVGAATLWQLGRRISGRVVLLAGATVAVAMLTPIIRATPLLAALPDPAEWYFRPVPGRTNFTLFPWGAFVTAGAVVGVFLQRAGNPQAERRTIAAVTLAGALIGIGGYGAAYLPTIYASSQFWTSSPTYFFVRTGLLMGAVGAAWAWEQAQVGRAGWSPLVLLGIESLFVYWIHVEIVYGVLTWPLHRRLPLPWTIVAFALFSVLMLGCAVLKRRVAGWWRASRAGARKAAKPRSSR